MFNIGQTVRCINSANNPFLNKGKLYKVTFDFVEGRGNCIEVELEIAGTKTSGVVSPACFEAIPTV